MNPGDTVSLPVLVTDRSGNPVAGAPLLFIAPDSGPSGLFQDAVFVRAVTGADGTASASFTAGNTPGVFLVAANLENTAAAVTFAITVNSASLNPVLTPSAVRSMLRDQILNGAVEDENLQLHGPVLVDAGTLVQSAGPGEFSSRVTTASWVFWIDDTPNAEFAHPVRIVIVDATTATPDLTVAGTVNPANWWPAIQIGANSIDLISPVVGDELSIPAAPQPSSSQVQRLASSFFAQVSPDAEGVRAGIAQNANACTIIVFGPSVGGQKDPPYFGQFLTSSGLVPAGNVFSYGTVISPVGGERSSTRLDLQAMVAAAKDQGCAKIYLLVHAHGYPSKNGQPGGIVLRKAGGGNDFVPYSDYINILTPLKGVQICMIQGSCFSGQLANWIQAAGLTGTLITSADSSHSSYFKPHISTTSTSNLITATVECWKDPNANGGSGMTDFTGAYNWAIANSAKYQGGGRNAGTNYLTSPMPMLVPITPTVSSGFTAPAVLIMMPGQNGTIPVTRPAGVALNSTFVATITLGQNGVASVGASGTVTLAPGAMSGTITVNGLASGSTQYSINGVDQATGISTQGIESIWPASAWSLHSIRSMLE